MNVGDFSTVFAAQIAAAYPRRSTFERSEASAAARRARREADDERAELRPTVEIAPNSKVGDEQAKNELKKRADEKNRRAENRAENRLENRADVPRRFWESRVDRSGAESFRESTTPPNDELGKRLDVFC